MSGKYDDIIHLLRPVSPTHPPMPIANRAAQFSPFAALTGHNAAIREVARYTREKVDLDEQYQEVLGGRLQEIQERGTAEVKVTFFREDRKKAGGEYVTLQGKVSVYEGKQCLVFEDGTKIPFVDIIEVKFTTSRVRSSKGILTQ